MMRRSRTLPLRRHALLAAAALLMATAPPAPPASAVRSAEPGVPAQAAPEETASQQTGPQRAAPPSAPPPREAVKVPEPSALLLFGGALALLLTARRFGRARQRPLRDDWSDEGSGP